MFRKITGFSIFLSLLMLIGGEWMRLSPIDFGVFTALYKSLPHTMPIMVAGQLLLINGFFWLLFALYLRLNPKVILSRQPQSRLFVVVALFVLFIQVLLGDWTTANHAALACRGFPQCNGTWLPALNYENALNLFYGLQNNYSGAVAYDAQITLAWLHRAGALLCFVILSGVTFQATSAPSKMLRKAGLWLSGLLFLQISLSILTIKLDLPWWMSVIHGTLATLLMLPLIAIHFYSKYDFPFLLESEAEKPELPVTGVRSDSLYGRLKSQLQRTRNGLGGVFSTLSLSKTIDDDLLAEIEANLLMADVGVEATSAIIAKLNERVTRSELKDSAALEAILKEELLEILRPCSLNLTIPKQDKPFVILVVGVNGAGKTTTIGKLANRLKMQGHSVMLAAGDTFRAAAVEQLQTWGDRNHIQVVAQHTGADSASVIFDAIQSAQAKGIDVLIADTAGRLQTKSNLMDELKKVKRIMSKLDDTAPHEVLLVLDAGTGQNAISQTKLFNEAVALTGLTLTKLDGTAKGGIIFALAKQFGIPIRFIGIGESIEDLQDFDAEKFVNALFIKD
ncbi:MAG: signal recognition particle-docking protein FtsY [Methylococcaceae bacterium]|nr:signal recognition particle-docking protein FtsY [Methylococcaceae bacterium]